MNPPIVLRVQMHPCAPSVFGAARPNARLRGRWVAQKKVRKRITVTEPGGGRTVARCEGKRTACIGRFAGIELESEEVRSELHAVRTLDP